jgi:hypothetical protein
MNKKLNKKKYLKSDNKSLLKYSLRNSWKKRYFIIKYLQPFTQLKV